MKGKVELISENVKDLFFRSAGWNPGFRKNM